MRWPDPRIPVPRALSRMVEPSPARAGMGGDPAGGLEQIAERRNRLEA
jgi:hypothetical protein